MKRMHGAALAVRSNSPRTRAAPRPEKISTKSEPEQYTNGTPASAAVARASSVLPVPGGPTSSTPLGARAPAATKRPGSVSIVTISCTSRRAPSQPATSANESDASSCSRRATRPTFPTLPLSCWRMTNATKPRYASSTSPPSCGALRARNGTRAASSASVSSGSRARWPSGRTK